MGIGGGGGGDVGWALSAHWLEKLIHKLSTAYPQVIHRLIHSFGFIGVGNRAAIVCKNNRESDFITIKSNQGFKFTLFEWGEKTYNPPMIF